jgi:hypothetical protein
LTVRLLCAEGFSSSTNYERNFNSFDKGCAQRKGDGLAGGNAEVTSTHGERLHELFAGQPSLAPPSPGSSRKFARKLRPQSRDIVPPVAD